jgi:hypothetical protein
VNTTILLELGQFLTEKASMKSRRSLAEQIADTEAKPQNETVAVPLRILRSLYCTRFYACRDGDYPSLLQYVAALIRRDKHTGEGRMTANQSGHSGRDAKDQKHRGQVEGAKEDNSSGLGFSGAIKHGFASTRVEILRNCFHPG